jgi:hypothetical protein
VTDQRLAVLIRQLQGKVGHGPYDAGFSLAAGATGSLAVAHGLGGTPSEIIGSVTGSAAVEFITWGWTADATNVTIFVKNHNAAGATVTVRFRAVI